MNFKSWLLISEMAKPSIEYLETNSLQALSEIERNPVLKARYKFLISEWDTKKNKLTPSDVTIGSGEIINWKCKEGHTWAATLNQRTSNGSNCFYCSLAIASLNKQKINDQKLKALAVSWTTKGKEPSRGDTFGDFLEKKRRAYQDFKKNKNNNNNTWYKTDIDVGEEVGLPDGWYLPPDKYKKQNDQNIINLGVYFNDKKKNPDKEEPPSTHPLGRFLYKKRRAYQDFKNDTTYSNGTWYKTDIDLGEKAGLPDGWYLFVKQNDQNIINLGVYFNDKKKNPDKEEPPATHPLGRFLYDKRKAYEDFKNDTTYSKKTWYKTDIDLGEKAGLPKDWYLFVDKNKEQNDQSLKKLGIYFNDKNNPDKEEPLANDPLGFFLYDKRRAYQDFKNDTDFTSRKWYKTDIDVGKKAGLPNGWYLPADKAKISKPAKLVGKILYKYFDDIIREHPDKGCNIITGRCFKFDYSFEYDGQEYFVEYHGEQHYYPRYFGSTKGMTDQKKAKIALDAFKVNQKNDGEKYNYCKNENFPLLVIPYWISPNKFEDLILNFIKHDDVFDDLFANPNVPDKNEKEHTRRLNMKKCFASGKLDCNEIFKKQKTTNSVTQEPTKTFEQFLINKNFINI